MPWYAFYSACVCVCVRACVCVCVCLLFVGCVPIHIGACVHAYFLYIRYFYILFACVQACVCEHLLSDVNRARGACVVRACM